MSYTNFSNLESLRCKRHGKDSTLTLLSKAVGGYSVLGVLTKRFFIGRKFATQQGAYITILTADRPDALAATAKDLAFVDLFQPALAGSMRYRVSAETRPSTIEVRWVLELTAAFNDTSAII